MKFLQDTPHYICNPQDSNYCFYMDTDSVYMHAEPILKYLYPEFEQLDEKEKDEKLEKVALYYQDYITNSYDKLAKDIFNTPTHRFEMKTECVIRSAYFRATRRYAQWITKEEGVEKDNLDIKGLEFKKANFPPVLGKFFRDTLIKVLKGAKKEDIDNDIKSFRTKIFKGEVPIKDLGNPTSVKTLNKYTEKPAKSGEMFSSITKGAPAAVRATIIYNDLIKFWGLNKKHNYITQGEKIKWVYLKPNPYQIPSIAFLDYDIPEKINKLLEQYVDRKRIFESILLNKLEGFYNDLGWTLNLNPYKNKFFNF